MSNQEMKFNVYIGDGNHGTFFNRTIDAADIDAAGRKVVAAFEARTAYEDGNIEWEEDGDEDNLLTLTAYDGPNGERAHNGGAWYCIEITPAGKDPRTTQDHPKKEGS